MTAVLNVAANVSRYYSDKGEEIEIQIVAFNAGLHLVRDDTSPVKQRVAAFSKSMPNVRFKACQNTIDAMAKREGKVDSDHRRRRSRTGRCRDADGIVVAGLDDRSPLDASSSTAAIVQRRWPAERGVMRRPLAPNSNRPNPTDPGDAADLSTP